MFCSKCGKEVPLDAAFCPACGVSRVTGAASRAPTATVRKSLVVPSLVVIIGLIIMIWRSCASIPDTPIATVDPTPAVESTPAVPVQDTIQVDGAIGCLEKAEFEKLSLLSDVNDHAGFAAAYYSAIASGQCVELAKGTRIHVEAETSSADLDLVQLRPEGSTIAYWTKREAIEPKN